MKYTVVYRENGSGYNYRVRNEDGQYAAHRAGWYGRKSIRSWLSGSMAWSYIEKHMDSKCVWAADPDDQPYIGGAGRKSMRHQEPATTADSYKLVHAGYPEPEGTVKPRCLGHELDRMAASQPLVWPVLPQADDGSNEEPTTVPDALVQAVAQRVFIIRLRGALRSY